MLVESIFPATLSDCSNWAEKRASALGSPVATVTIAQFPEFANRLYISSWVTWPGVKELVSD